MGVGLGAGVSVPRIVAALDVVAGKNSTRKVTRSLLIVPVVMRPSISVVPVGAVRIVPRNTVPVCWKDAAKVGATQRPESENGVAVGVGNIGKPTYPEMVCERPTWRYESYTWAYIEIIPA